MKSKDIRALSSADIEKQIRESREELASLNVRKTVGQVENTAKLRSLRRDIARMSTVLTEKQRANA